MELLNQNDIAIDLGTANTVVYNDSNGILFNEATCIAVEWSAGAYRVVALGNRAKQMLGRTPKNYDVIRPVLNGAISDFEMTKMFMSALIEKFCSKFRRPRVGISIPQNLTQVEKNYLYEAIVLAGARDVIFIEDPFSIAIGSDLDIESAHARMLIDLGAGLSEISVIALNGLVVSNFTKIGGDFIDNVIVEHLAHQYNLAVGLETAEFLKKSIHLKNLQQKEGREFQIYAKNLHNGMPGSFCIKESDLLEAVLPSIIKLKETVIQTFREIPPQIAPDILDDGILVSGGFSLFGGLREFLEQELQLKLTLSPDPLLDISKGVCRILRNTSD